VTVEGKAGEEFDKRLVDWLKSEGDGKERRLAFLCKTLGVTSRPDPGLRYQLFHRAASAVLEAQRWRSSLVADELQRRQDRLFERRHQQARFRDPDRSLDGFDFDFNKKLNRALVHDLATARFIAQREDVLLLGPPGTGKSHLAQAIGRAAIQQGDRVLYPEAHTLLEELADATLDGTRKAYLADLGAVPLPSSTTWACASCRTPPPRICSSGSCGATNEPPRY
jgi:hypothetical protein